MEMLRPAVDVQTMAIEFEVVPAYDLIMSLAAAAHPEEHELPVAWAREVRAALPSAARRDLTYFFGDPARLGTGAVQLVPELGVSELEHFLLAVETVDPAEFAVAVLSRGLKDPVLRTPVRRLARGKTLGPEEERALQQAVRALRAETRKRFWEIATNPQASRDRYIGLLRAHNERWFAAHYGEILPFLVQRAKQGRRSIGKLPAREVIARATKGFTLQSQGARTVTLVPSFYAAPFVMVVRDGRDVVLAYGARPSEPATGRSPLAIDTVRVLKALADETRLRILQLLVQQPLYGGQLAERLGVSHPTVSHHMAQLRIAGLTRTELAADGNKTYSVRPETVELLCAELRGAFVDPALPAGDG